jgi:putative SOS response-associated peptidase YedK
MPVILSEQDEADWLNPQLGMDDAKALIAPYATSDMEAYEVSARVNSPRNNTPDLIKPR